MCTSSQSGARGLERLPCLKYNALTWENRMTLRLNAVENSDCMRKSLKWKLLTIQFPIKNFPGIHVCLPQSEARVLQRLSCLKYYNVLKWESKLTSGFNPDKRSYCVKKNRSGRLVKVQSLKKQFFKKKKNHSGTDMSIWEYYI